MISSSQAFDIVMDNTKEFGIKTVSLADSIGRVMAQDIVTDRDAPPFHRVMMDGIAINYNTYKSGQKTFVRESIGAAGQPQLTLEDDQKCIEIMTGASLPLGSDTVVRYEDLEETENGYIILSIVKEGQNVHSKGADHLKGEIVLTAGQRIKAIDINVLATVGYATVPVYQNPTVAIISSGDELVHVDEEPLDYQIRMSNVHMLVARCLELGITANHYHISDVKNEITQTLSSILESYDVLLLSGGVSKGKFDFIPEVLADLNVIKAFHRVAQRPGKPFWFGTREQKTVFAFPGNPVSTLVCYHKYFIPWLMSSINQKYNLPQVFLKNDVSFKPELTYFAQAKISFESGQLMATVAHGNGSGDMIHPTKMDGFVELGAKKSVFKSGELVTFIPFHPIIY